MTWQAAIDALRVLQDFGVSDERCDGFEAPTEACIGRALAWMEARSFTDPIRWPTRIGTMLRGGIEIGFGIGRDLYLSAEFRNDGTAEWIEYRAGKIIATGQIALRSQAEINVTELCVMCGEPCLSVACADCQTFAVESVQVYHPAEYGTSTYAPCATPTERGT